MRGGYSTGLKYCSTCGKFLATDGLRCPKCKRMLRVRPRGGRDRGELRYVEVHVVD